MVVSYMASKKFQQSYKVILAEYIIKKNIFGSM